MIDDEPFIGHMVQRALRGRFAVDCEVRATAALIRLRDGNRYDVILSDVMMPEMNGLELWEIVRRELPLLAPTFRFMTGCAGAERMTQGVPTLAKPFSRLELIEFVEAGVATDAPRAVEHG